MLHEPDNIFKEIKVLYNRLNVVPSDLRGLGIHLSRLEKEQATNAVLHNFLKNSINKLEKSDNQLKTDSTVNKPKETLNYPAGTTLWYDNFLFVKHNEQYRRIFSKHQSIAKSIKGKLEVNKPRTNGMNNYFKNVKPGVKDKVDINDFNFNFIIKLITQFFIIVANL